jgi:isopenicillin-N epimerase
MNPIKELFQLDPSITFLNHGSFGAVPIEVFDTYQDWQRRLEFQPVKFLGREITSLMKSARASLADFLHAMEDEVLYFPNPTTAMNMVARNMVPSLNEQNSHSGGGFKLRPGDEILTSDHEYGAMDRTWNYVCQSSGANYRKQTVAIPLEDDPQAFVDRFWEGVTSRTRVIFISHITSPTAIIFPVQEICRRARQTGILSIVDGAHAPGQIPLNLTELGADIYTGACHKWLMAPKGSAFLYVRKELQQWMDPLVISWGFAAEAGYGSGQRWIDYHEWQGTRDMAAFLSVPRAIEFQRIHAWDAVRDRCHHLAVSLRRSIQQLTGYEAVCPETSRWFAQMFSVHLPPEIDPKAFQARLYQDYQIEVPVMKWKDHTLLRVSVQGYNDQADADSLLDALTELLHKR